MFIESQLNRLKKLFVQNNWHHIGFNWLPLFPRRTTQRMFNERWFRVQTVIIRMNLLHYERHVDSKKWLLICRWPIFMARERLIFESAIYHAFACNLLRVIEPQFQTLYRAYNFSIQTDPSSWSTVQLQLRTDFTAQKQT